MEMSSSDSSWSSCFETLMHQSLRNICFHSLVWNWRVFLITTADHPKSIFQRRGILKSISILPAQKHDFALLHYSRRSSCFWFTTADHGEALTLLLTAWTAATPLKNEEIRLILEIQIQPGWNVMRNTWFPPGVKPHSWQRSKGGESDEKHAGRWNKGKEKGRNRSNWSCIVRLRFVCTINLL